MAIFGKKKSDEATPAQAKGSFQPDPAKAEKWFSHARTMHESSNFEYATTCWLKGLGCDPANPEALQAFFKSAQAFAAGRSKPGPTKEQVKAVEGKGPVNRYLTTLLRWGARPMDAASALRAVESAAALRLVDSARWLGEFALRAARNEPKPKKDSFIKLMEVLESVEVYDLAAKAGEDAMHLDPTDGQLSDRLRNISAKAAMSAGGFDDSGEEGGFHKNVRDSERQRKLREQQQIVRSDDVAQSVVEDAKADYENRPQDRHAIQKYARALLDRGKPEDEKIAIDVLNKGFEDLKEERFREAAKDIELRQFKRRVIKARDALRADPEDASKREAYERAARGLLEREAQEYQRRVDTYPTDLGYRYELGRRLYQLGRYEEAIEHLQEAQSDAKRRVQVRNLLGQSFQKLGWHSEAAGMLRQAIEAHQSSDDDLALDLRYGLMDALEAQAREESDVEAAEEATQLASGIAMKQISYRDVRQRRDALQKLVKNLKANGEAT